MYYILQLYIHIYYFNHKFSSSIQFALRGLFKTFICYNMQNTAIKLFINIGRSLVCNLYS